VAAGDDLSGLAEVIDRGNRAAAELLDDERHDDALAELL
jgi:hypothetical protein